jgi:serine/threonine protein kinase
MQQQPEKIDKYQILSVIGRGAMGVVYHAYDAIVKRDVALKLLSSLDVEEKELISRFEREARLAGGLRHPNIVTVYDMGNYEGRPYIVMEFITGRDLETVIKEKQPLTILQRVEIILQVCKGLDAAHQKGIIHRDIKPANIRLQDDNMVKIMDFGIARVGTSTLTRSGYIIGTLQYMSPEQISGEQLDPRTDLFSTGVIAYELFTHINPFASGGAVEIMYKLLNLHPKPIEDLPDEHGTELNQIIMRALEKNRVLRYPTAKAMVTDLEEFLFYIKSLNFKRSTGPRLAPSDKATQHIPREQLPLTTVQDDTIPPTVSMDMQKSKFPTFGVPQEEKAPRTGIGANYSETAQQVLMRQESTWRDKKFYIIGAVVALLFIGALFYAGGIKKNPPVDISLQVSSKPEGAQVWVDGQKSGTTPMKFAQKRDMTLTFRLDGFQEKVMTIREDAWPSEVNVTLDPILAKTETPASTTEAKETGRLIKIESTPPGATLLMDGQEAGITPAQIALPDDNPHQLALQLSGFQPVTQTIDADTGATLSFQLQVEEPKGTLSYSGQYPVTIFSKGKALKGNTLQLDPGTYKLTFKAKQKAYINFTRTVELKGGDTKIISAPPMGILTVKANPSNCKISIDGDVVDDAPIFNLPVQSGNHVIRFNWVKMGKTLDKAVEIPQGQTVSITGVPD